MPGTLSNRLKVDVLIDQFHPPGHLSNPLCHASAPRHRVVDGDIDRYPGLRTAFDRLSTAFALLDRLFGLLFHAFALLALPIFPHFALQCFDVGLCLLRRLAHGFQ